MAVSSVAEWAAGGGSGSVMATFDHMRQFGPRLAGAFPLAVGLVLVASACSALGPQAGATPSPARAAASPPPAVWGLHLDVSGDVTGTIGEVAANQPGQRNECTGTHSQTSGTWASTVYGLLGGQRYALLVYIPSYLGPGTYGADKASVQFYDAARTQVWQSQAGAAVSVQIGADQQAGTLAADLANLVAGSGGLHVSGHWSCG